MTTAHMPTPSQRLAARFQSANATREFISVSDILGTDWGTSFPDCRGNFDIYRDQAYEFAARLEARAALAAAKVKA